MRGIVLVTSSLLALFFMAMAGSPYASARAGGDPQLAAEWQRAWQFEETYEALVAPLPTNPRSSVTRELSVEVNAPVDQAMAAFAAVENEALGAGGRRYVTHRTWTDDAGSHADFTAISEATRGHAETRIHVKQIVHRDQPVIELHTWAAPNIATHHRFEFTDLGGGRTRITQQLMLLAPRPLVDAAVLSRVAAQLRANATIARALSR
ncbi:hypothetical protein FOS14_03550 [Skermania sp. ID1734]|uniref:hypothetical protein n=1 Tax=Skermania sp. ID1734 TaxID=2597516 RepID=UPI00117E961C|nr:hypothetical protein [Skermania sp. ID1734]TSE01617.1 hypothetical protein FOS14_03550 [Skermania sp. ID1734]